MNGCLVRCPAEVDFNRESDFAAVSYAHQQAINKHALVLKRYGICCHMLTIIRKLRYFSLARKGLYGNNGRNGVSARSLAGKEFSREREDAYPVSWTITFIKQHQSTSFKIIGICPLGAAENTDSRRCVLKPCGVVANSASWSEWAEWSGCSVACGPGLRRRFRHCGAPIGALIITDGGFNDANDCGFGEREQSEACQGSCDSGGPIIPLLVTGSPIDAHTAWTSWQLWTTCTATCGGGVRER